MEYDRSVLMQRVDGVKPAAEAGRGRRMTLHCAHCNAVLADSLGVCGEARCVDSVVCLGVTNDVIISDEMESGHKGEMTNCIYSCLKCRGCRCAVGKVIHSAPSHLAALRSLFLLYKANIRCYILNSSSMVKASKLTFDLKPLRENINEVRQHFEAQLDQMSHVKSRLANMSLTSEFDK